jgi:hypothetical protein
MGLFRKRTDPLALRSQSLNRRIAELEAEIARLHQNAPAPPSPDRPASTAPFPPAAEAGRGSRPHPSPNEPVFVPMPTRPGDPQGSDLPGRGADRMGLKRPLWSQWWGRAKRHFIDPPPANEKLVNYLAAGGIQGLRPLRYERRIARNRIIFICVVLGLLLWGLLVVFWQTR